MSWAHAKIDYSKRNRSIRAILKKKYGIVCSLCMAPLTWKENIPYNKGTDVLHNRVCNFFRKAWYENRNRVSTS